MNDLFNRIARLERGVGKMFQAPTVPTYEMTWVEPPPPPSLPTLTGRVVAKHTFGGRSLQYPSTARDNLVLTDSVASTDMVQIMIGGAFSTKTSDGTPFPTNEYSFPQGAYNPNFKFMMNYATTDRVIRGNDSDPSLTGLEQPDSTVPGVKTYNYAHVSGPLNAGDTVQIEWLAMFMGSTQPMMTFAQYEVLMVAVSGVTMQEVQYSGIDSGECKYVDSMDVNYPYSSGPGRVSGTSFSINSATSAQSADAGKDVVAIGCVGWIDASAGLPTISSDWTILGYYIDSVYIYGLMIVGKYIASGDTTTHVCNFTFPNNVRFSGNCYVYQVA